MEDKIAVPSVGNFHVVSGGLTEAETTKRKSRGNIAQAHTSNRTQGFSEGSKFSSPKKKNKKTKQFIQSQVQNPIHKQVEKEPE